MAGILPFNNLIFPTSTHHSCSASSHHLAPWIIDTGATDHMICSPSLFTTITCTTQAHVQLPNGTQVAVTHIGTVQLSPEIRLTNVLCVPSFTFNLLSVSKLTHNPSLCVVFLRDHCFTQVLSSWMTVGLAKNNHGLYYLLPSSLGFKSSNSKFNSQVACTTKHPKIDVWHFRLRHLSSQRMNLIQSSFPDVKFSNQDHCTVCHLAKQKRVSFPVSITRSDSIFDLIHCDVWGPYSQPSLQGHQYFLTIVDDHSRVTWVHLMKFKSETKQILQSFIRMVGTQFNSKVKQVRTDNGMEFHMPDFFNTHGILPQKTCAYTPQQNGVMERKHQHLLNVTRALLFQTNLPLRFWVDAVLTATYLINRIPTPILDNKTPYEFLFGSTPSYANLRVFDCLCYMSTLKHTRTKLDPRAKPCIFIGYPAGVKGYKVYDLYTHSTSISRDVTFLESTFPFTQSSSISVSDPSPSSLTLPPVLPDISFPFSTSSDLAQPSLDSSLERVPGSDFARHSL